MRKLLMLVGAAALCLLAYVSLPWRFGAPRSGDYWINVGSYSWRGGEGIYLFRLHTATGKVERSGLAAGNIWRANRGALAGSLPRVIAQIRGGWPDVRAIAKGVQNPVYLAAHPN